MAKGRGKGGKAVIATPMKHMGKMRGKKKGGKSRY